MEQTQKKTSRLEKWAMRPYRKRGTVLVFYLILAMAISAMWVHLKMDND